MIPILYGDVGGLGGRVEAVGRVVTSSSRGVGVDALQHGICIIHEVLEGRELVATVATVVYPIIRELITMCIHWMDTNRAINELLLRKGKKFSCFGEVSTLESSYGREGVACATMSLVLDWAIKTLLNPIERLWRVYIAVVV